MSVGQEVFKFSDFRSFLKAHYEDKKRQNPQWSIRSWARHLNLSAAASLSMVMNGQRQPGPRMVESFVRYFQFADPKEKLYFLDLVRVQKIKRDPDLKHLLLEKIRQQHPEGKVRMLDADQFAAVSQWYHYAIREMTRLPNFREDPHWIKSQLQFNVPVKDLEQALRRLIELKMLVRGPDGRLRSSPEDLNTPTDFADEGLKRFHEGMIEQAKSAVRGVPVLEREIVGSTFTLDSETLPQAKLRIRAFLNEMINLYEAQAGDVTFQLNIQLFPLTKLQKDLNESTMTPESEEGAAHA